MNWIIYLIFYIIMIVIMACLSYSNDAPDGRRFQKKFAKKIKAIMDFSSESIEIHNKGKTFKIEFEEHQDKGIHYETIPYYKSIDIYINKKLVCRLHRLEIDYHKYIYRIEFSSKVLYTEVIELIDIACKDVVRKEKESLKTKANEISENSFYKNS